MRSTRNWWRKAYPSFSLLPMDRLGDSSPSVTRMDTQLPSTQKSQSRQRQRWTQAADSDVGSIHKVCANASCPVHHPKQQTSRNDEKEKAEHEKQRKEQAIANASGLRVLAAVSAAVPVRLMKRDLLFVIEKLVSLMEEQRLEMLARQHGIRQKRDDGGIGKTLAAYIRRADEGTLSRLLVETSILLAASRSNPATILRDAASMYKVDTDAITVKVKQEFAAKEKAKKTPQSTAKTAKKAA
jgi:ParB family transcriptional regulator, chromosome partitioning protein